VWVQLYQQLRLDQGSLGLRGETERVLVDHMYRDSTTRENLGGDAGGVRSSGAPGGRR
jgi:hypothetical protein